MSRIGALLNSVVIVGTCAMLIESTSGSSLDFGHACRQRAVPGRKTQCHISVIDRGARNGSVDRYFNLYVPKTVNASTWWQQKLPAMFHFHGGYAPWGFRDPDLDPYQALADQHGFVIFYPLGTCAGEKCGCGWQVIYGGHERSTCTNTSYASSCCPDSCKRLGKCSGPDELANCGYSQCYDEQGFVELLLSMATRDFGIDSEHIFATGASEGGTLLYDLLGRLPSNTFKAFVPVYAAPFAGFLKTKSRAIILSLHGRSDSTIPVAGGVSNDGWIYMPEADIMKSWAQSLGCLSTSPAKFEIPFEAESLANISCIRFDICPTPSVVQCLYDGGHGGWPSRVANSLVIWWFFSRKANLETSILV